MVPRYYAKGTKDSAESENGIPGPHEVDRPAGYRVRSSRLASSRAK